MVLDEMKIQYALFSYLIQKGRQYIIPNIYNGGSEADVLTTTAAGYLQEYEIKISLADFKADFKKPKHWQMKNGFPHGQYHIDRFWYVAPINAVPLCIPDYAGLVEASIARMGYILLRVVKPAPKLNGEKYGKGFRDKALKSLMYKYWNLAKNLNQQKCEREVLNNI